jgi:hypothetical protein
MIKAIMVPWSGTTATTTVLEASAVIRKFNGLSSGDKQLI